MSEGSGEWTEVFRNASKRLRRDEEVSLRAEEEDCDSVGEVTSILLYDHSLLP